MALLTQTRDVAAQDDVAEEFAWAQERPNRLTESLYLLDKLVRLSPDDFYQVEAVVDDLLAADLPDGG